MMQGAQIRYSVTTSWVGVGGGREVQEGGDIVCLCLIHVDVWQKPNTIL